jgi:hypothetical protein
MFYTFCSHSVDLSSWRGLWCFKYGIFAQSCRVKNVIKAIEFSDVCNICLMDSVQDKWFSSTCTVLHSSKQFILQVLRLGLTINVSLLVQKYILSFFFSLWWLFGKFSWWEWHHGYEKCGHIQNAVMQTNFYFCIDNSSEMWLWTIHVHAVLFDSCRHTYFVFSEAGRLHLSFYVEMI